MRDYPMLRHFFGAYLHQDWIDEFPDEWAALDGFLADGAPENAQVFRSDIAALLAEHPAEEEVRRALDCLL